MDGGGEREREEIGVDGELDNTSEACDESNLAGDGSEPDGRGLDGRMRGGGEVSEEKRLEILKTRALL